MDRLGDALGKAVVEPAIARRFTELGSDTRAMTAREFAAYVESENAKWTPIVRSANIKPE